LSLVNTEPHSDHINGNSYFPGVEVIAQEGLKARYEQAIPQITSETRVERMKEQDPDSVWLLGHPDYPPNRPSRTFADELTLVVGDHTIRCIHTAGHTEPQTAIHIAREGVVFTGDNIFFHVKTFIQEGDPWKWLKALDIIGGLDADVIVPGHGEPCDKAYLRSQAQVLENWLGLVEDYVRRGMTEEEAVAEPLDVPGKIDPYPIGQRLFGISDWVTQANIRNLYKRIKERNAAGP
jgi:glyoxylase-like metal-dependent hydrolase (beta-lactamase superfamily II)